MTDERWHRTWEVFHQTLELDLEAWPEFLDEACAGDEELRQAVEGLLSSHREGLSLLDKPPTPEADAAPPAVESPGGWIGPYQLLSKLGEGGMGVVYRARQTEPLERTVALKLIQVGMNTREVMARFERERRALARLEHPHIARVLDAGSTDNGRPYFVMELVDGQPLHEFCDQRRLSTRQRLRLFVPICQAVHHAHQKGIIHRDLKPSNVLVVEHDGEFLPKVIDFGVARAVDRVDLDRTQFTEHGRWIGTPEYMSPEQAQGSLDIDIRSDVYALGVLLYEMLTGCLPLESAELRHAAFDRLREVLQDREPRTPSTRISSLGGDAYQVALRRRTDPSSLRRELRGDLDWIIMCAMAKDRERRYGAASDLAQEIERHLRDEPVQAGPPSWLYRSKKFVRRHRFGVATTSLLTFLVILFALSTLWQAARTRRALEEAEQASRRAEQVSAFLVDLFEVSDPGRAQGNSIRARELLDRGAQNIDRELRDQPDVQAEMMGVIGQTYTRLGLYEEAETLLTKSLSARRELLPMDDPELGEGLRQLAELKVWQGDFDGAEQLLRSSLTAMSSTSTDASLDRGRTLGQLSIVLRESGHLEEAEEVAREALDLHRQCCADEGADLVRSLSNLGLVLYRQGRHDEAQEVFVEARRMARHLQLAPGHPDRLSVTSHLGVTLFVQGRHDEAEALLREALDGYRKVYGEAHPQVASALNNLAAVLQRSGKDQEVEDLYLRNLEIMREALGEEHPDVATTLSNLGSFYRRRGRADEGIPLLRRALEIHRRTVGEDHTKVAFSLNNLGVALDGLRKPGDRAAAAEVEAVFQEGLQIYRDAESADPTGLAEILGNLGVHYRRTGRNEEAETAYLQVLEIEEEHLGPEHPNVALRLYNLGSLLSQTQRLDGAETYLRRALDIYRSAFGESHFEVGHTQAGLGKTLMLAGDLEASEPLLREGLRIQAETLPEGHWRLAVNQTYLGQWLVLRGRFEEAETLLLEAQRLLLAAKGPDDPSSQDVAKALADLEAARVAR